MGSLTWNSQCSFLLPLDNGRWMYMGDRWSFPRQRQAATYVWLPIEAHDGQLSIPEYWEQWNPLTGQQAAIDGETVGKRWKSTRVGDTFKYNYEGTQIGLYGNTDDESGYADISIKDKAGKVVFHTNVDFYSLTPAQGLRWLSPNLPKGKYTLEVKVSEMKPNWTDKKKIIYGSKGHKVEITGVVVNQFVAPEMNTACAQQYYPVRDRLEVVNLDGTWQFQLEGEQGWRTIQVPGNWETQGVKTPDYGRNLKQMTGIYRRMFSLPEEWRGRDVVLRLDGVQHGFTTYNEY